MQLFSFTALHCLIFWIFSNATDFVQMSQLHNTTLYASPVKLMNNMSYVK